MVKIQLTAEQVLEYIINGNYQAAINLAQDYLDAFNNQTKEEGDERI